MTIRSEAVHSSVGRKARRWRDRLGLVGWLYALPTAVVVGLLFALPVGLAVWMSFHDWPLIGAATFNFPANYTRVISDDLFVQGVKFSVTYAAIVTPTLLGMALGLALIVQSPGRWIGFLRTAYFMPAVVGLTAAALLFYGMYSPVIGPLSPALMAIGVIDKPIDWLGTPNTALLSTVLLMIWRFSGFYMLILLSGLQAIPVQVYEAARIDGGNSWQIFRHVTLPLLRPSLALCLILCVTGSLLAFEQFYVLTRGGPDNSTVTMVMAMFRQAFTVLNLGRASAMAVVILIALLVVNYFQMSAVRKQDA